LAAVGEIKVVDEVDEGGLLLTEGVVAEEGLVDEIVGLGVGETRELVLVGEETGDEMGFADADVAVDEAGLRVLEAHVDEGGV